MAPAAPTKLTRREKRALLPLKAYEVFWFGETLGDWAGHTRGHAQGRAARSTWCEGQSGAVVWGKLSAKRIIDEKRTALAIETLEDEGKYWGHTKRCQRLQAEADLFNATYPVGSPVRVIDCYEANHWPDGLTTIRTPAWVANAGTVVLVSVEGQSGGMFMKHIQPISTP